MAVLSRAFVLASVVVQVFGNACPGTEGIMDMITEMAPKCFEACSQLCGPVETLVSDYMAGTSDEAAMGAQICKQQGRFSCLYEPENLEECGKLATQANSFDIKMPLSMDELSSQCEAFENNGTAHDANDETSEAETETEKSKTETETTSASSAVAVPSLLLLAAVAFFR